MRLAWVFYVALAAGAWAGDTASYEVVLDRNDIEILPDGNYVEADETRYRVLSPEGIVRLHQQTLGFVQGYETLRIEKAYTLKADGTRLDVPQNGILNGVGLSSEHGVSDRMQMNLFFPNVEVGDTLVLITVRRQLKPIVPGSFSRVSYQPVDAAVRDASYDVTAPEGFPLHIDAGGLTEAGIRHAGGKVRYQWSYRRDTVAVREADAVSEIDVAPHLILSNYDGYGRVAAAYRDASREQSKPTDDIVKLAEGLTAGTKDKREQARRIYEWVVRQIAYASIVLGNGSFTPHYAGDVLSARYGDCKDHVALLEALLAARGIRSTAVLVHVATPSYRLPKAAAVFYFDHVITYLPDFDLYLDSTSPLAPFGTLPAALSGKPGVRVDSGKTVRLPLATSANTGLRLKSRVEIAADGSVDSRTTVEASGAIGIEMRASMHALPPGKDKALLQNMLGPGTSGEIDRGAPLSLHDPYTVYARARIPDVIPTEGLAALPFYLAYKPFSFTGSLAGALPLRRDEDYVCMSGYVEDDQTVVLPANETILALPPTTTLRAKEVTMQFVYARKDAHSFEQKISLRMDHPGATCTPDYYASVRADVARMVQTLRRQVILQPSGAVSSGGKGKDVPAVKPGKAGAK